MNLSSTVRMSSMTWKGDTFPDTWRQMAIILIPETSKDTSNPQNYWPITLISYFCKMMEWMINNRLIWYLNSNSLITNLQIGFSKKRGTIEDLICLETFIREAFIKKTSNDIFFFTWRKHITLLGSTVLWETCMF